MDETVYDEGMKMGVKETESDDDKESQGKEMNEMRDGAI